jgi:hypothetical protein
MQAMQEAAGVLTMAQTPSALMIVAGLLLVARAWRVHARESREEVGWS